jgi:hypothetical protein
LDIVSGANTKGVEEGSADYKELELILSKLGCLKKDLMSPSSVVDATRYQPFATSHDRISVADVCGMCLNQTISARDLDIVFATWRDRGKLLLRKLCTEAQLRESEVVKVDDLFKKAWEDVYDITKSRGLKTNFPKQNGGDVGAFEPNNLSIYANNYNGLSASGGNGAV